MWGAWPPYEYSVLHLPLAGNSMDKINALIIVINIRLWFSTESEPIFFLLWYEIIFDLSDYSESVILRLYFPINVRLMALINVRLNKLDIVYFEIEAFLQQKNLWNREIYLVSYQI